MGHEKLTVIVLPGGAGSPRTLGIRRRWLRVMGVAALIGLASIVILVLSYRSLRRQVVEFASLQAQTSSHQVQLASMSEELKDLRDQLHRVRKLDRKLRLMASLEPPPESSAPLLGLGGPSPSSSAAKEVFIADRQSTLIESMRQELAKLRTVAGRQETSFHELVSAFHDMKSLLAHTPSIWPVRGWVTSGFGRRISPFTGKRALHAGIDIASRNGAVILAPADGVVTRVTSEYNLGKLVEIDHGYGFSTRFGHNSQVLVHTGQRVRRGDPIARVGNTGRSTGPHVHYEIRLDGVPVNPKRYLVEDETL
ncbi:MAG: M23 family metallopeptidase [bacterium]|nr:M23 family metallopeptidase [bacterium]